MNRAIKLTGVVAMFFALGATVSADETTKGTIKSTDTGRNEVVLKGTIKDTVYELAKDATVWLDGKRAKLADLKADDKAVVVFTKSGDHYIASSVRGLRSADETSGTLADVIMDKREVVLKGTVKNTTYELVKDGTVYVDGKQASLKDIRAGDEVLITYERRGDHYMARDVTVYKRQR